MSGGFVYTRDGFWIGLQHGYNDTTRAGYAAPVESLAQFLKDSYPIHKLELPEWIMALPATNPVLATSGEVSGVNSCEQKPTLKTP